MTTTDALDFKHHNYKEMRQVRSRFLKECYIICPGEHSCVCVFFLLEIKMMYSGRAPSYMLIVSRLRMPCWGYSDQRKPPSPANG